MRLVLVLGSALGAMVASGLARFTEWLGGAALWQDVAFLVSTAVLVAAAILLSMRHLRRYMQDMLDQGGEHRR